MIIYHNGTVIVWTDKGNRAFNDIQKADEYFERMKEYNPIWQRVEKPKKENK